MNRTILALPVLALLVGCAGTNFKPASFQDDVLAGNYASALERLDAFSEDDVSALLDRGLLFQSQGLYEASNASFAQAEVLIEDLYTRSLSKEALSLLTNDSALDYRASGFEYAYVAYYRAWNYLEQGLTQDVLVEARRINERLTFQSNSCENQDGACGHDVFLRYFSGLLFEWAGESNDAYIAYKQADIAQGTARERYGVLPPADLGPRLLRLARQMGFDDEAAVWSERYGIAAEDAPLPSSVVFIWENGIIGHREATGIIIPIYREETQLIAQDTDTWSRTLAARRNEPLRTQVKLDYLLRISLPHYVAYSPVGHRAELMIKSGDAVPVPRASALSDMAARSLDEAMGGIAVRAVARALVKYLAKEAAEKNIGETAGLLVNLLGVALEQADTRSWRSLPYEINVVSRHLPAGTYDLTLKVTGPDGKPVETQSIPTVTVPRNGISFVRHRSF